MYEPANLEQPTVSIAGRSQGTFREFSDSIIRTLLHQISMQTAFLGRAWEAENRQEIVCALNPRGGPDVYVGQEIPLHDTF
jgi:hypothetical protein